MKYIISIFFVFVVEMVWACATCYGAPQSPPTQGMNGAIWTLLVVTGGVLSSVIAGIISISKKTRSLFNDQKN